MAITKVSEKQIGDAVAFSAYRDVENADYSATGRVTFNKVVYNTGSAYNTSNGIFTAPYDGIYQINYSGYTNNNTGRSILVWYRPSTTSVIQGIQGEAAGKSHSATFYMLAGDQAWMEGNSSYPMRFYAAFNHNQFSGALIKRL